MAHQQIICSQFSWPWAYPNLHIYHDIQRAVRLNSTRVSAMHRNDPLSQNKKNKRPLSKSRKENTRQRKFSCAVSAAAPVSVISGAKKGAAAIHALGCARAFLLSILVRVWVRREVSAAHFEMLTKLFVGADWIKALRRWDGAASGRFYPSIHLSLSLSASLSAAWNR